MRRLVGLTALLVAVMPASGQAQKLARPTIAPVPSWKAPIAVEQTTPAGTPVVVLERHDVPLVRVVVVVRAGAEVDPPSHPGLASMTATMLELGGAGALGPSEVARQFELLGEPLDVQVQREGVRLETTVLTANLPAAMALLSDVVARPRFASDEWTRAQALQVATLEHQRDEPRHIADTVTSSLLFGETHPYGSPIDGTPASVSALKLEDVKAFYRDHYGPHTATVVYVGDVTPVAAAALTARTLGQWTSSAAPPPAPTVGKQPPARVVLVDRPGATQSALVVSNLAPPRATPEYPSLELMQTALGGSFTSRLVQNLRERHGYTYGVGDRVEMHRSGGRFFVSTAVRSDVTAPAITEVMNELRAIRDPMKAEELVKARLLIGSGLVETYSSVRGAASRVCELVEQGLPLDTWTRLPADLAAPSPADVAASARRWVLPDQLTIVVVGDRKSVEAPLRALPFVHQVEIRDLDGRLVGK